MEGAELPDAAGAPGRRPREHPRRAAPRDRARRRRHRARAGRPRTVALLGHARQRRPRAASARRRRARARRRRARAARMRAANGAGVLAAEQGDFAAARAYFEESLALARSSGGDGVTASRGRRQPRQPRALRGRLRRRRSARYEAGAAISARARRRRAALSLMLQNLGIAHAEAGAPRAGDRAARRERRHRPPRRRPGARDLDPAHARAAAAGRRRARAGAGDAARGDGALAQLNERPGLTESLETVSAVAARQGDPRTAALLIGAAGALRTAAGGIRQPDEDAWVQRIVADLREALGDDGLRRGRSRGLRARPRRRRLARAGAQRALKIP